jgi:hypothetical protein
MSQFVFKNYSFKNGVASFEYAFDDGRSFKESIEFAANEAYNEGVLDRALFLAFILIGTSYYKSFPATDMRLETPVDEWQSTFFNSVYQEGLSQFAYENKLTREDLLRFSPTHEALISPAARYEGEGIVALQSGGKDSLLVATILKEKELSFTPWYVSSSAHYPGILDDLGQKVLVSTRTLDYEALKKASDDGGKNGHVPVTYILESLALIQAILLGKKSVLVSIAHEGEEPHHVIGDLSVTHQWSKTWAAEKAFSEYVSRYISQDIQIGSPLRSYTELHVAELFVRHSWDKYGHIFSSCNVANYRQGNDNSVLKWCGNCPKCANSFLLFAPFVEANELKSIFEGQDLFAKQSLEYTFKGLLGIDGISKPFECVGEIDELRSAYHWAISKGGYDKLPFDVPESSFDYLQRYDSQSWATELLQ